MNAPFADDPRRHFGRMKLGIPAVLQTLEGAKHIRLVDLSQGGGLVLLPRAFPVRQGVLQWLGFEAYGTRVWQNEVQLGLAFDTPLPLAALVATRRQAPDLIREEEMAAERAAAGWAEGWLHLGGER